VPPHLGKSRDIDPHPRQHLRLQVSVPPFIRGADEVVTPTLQLQVADKWARGWRRSSQPTNVAPLDGPAPSTRHNHLQLQLGMILFAREGRAVNGCDREPWHSWHTNSYDRSLESLCSGLQRPQARTLYGLSFVVERQSPSLSYWLISLIHSAQTLVRKILSRKGANGTSDCIVLIEISCPNYNNKLKGLFDRGISLLLLKRSTYSTQAHVLGAKRPGFVSYAWPRCLSPELDQDSLV
jgi:hypothetical protein